MKIEGILFDFDGVIADTMDFNFECWNAAFSNYGYDLKKREYLLMEGTGAKTIGLTFIEKIDGPKPTWQQIQKYKNDLFISGYKLKIYPVIINIIKYLNEKKIPFALVTGSDRMRLKAIFDAELLKQFKGIVTMEDTQRGKPFADPYLRGAEILNVSPENCLVVENAPSGISAGKNAGAYTVALMTTLEKEDLSNADQIFINHEELFVWLEDQLNGR